MQQDNEHSDISITVVIPVYNRAEQCREAVKSAHEAISGLNAEIVVVDDGSDDNVAGAVGDFARVERIAHSGMPGRARNVAVERSSGTHVAFLDSDDLWYQDKIRKQLPRIVSGARMVHCRERWIRDGGEVSQRSHRHKRRGDIFKDALTKCIVGPSTFVIERALFEMSGGFREDMRVAEDYELALRLLAFEKIDYVDVPLVEKRDHAGPQLSHTYPHIEGFRIRALGDVLADMIEAQALSGDAARDGHAGLMNIVEAIDGVAAFHGENSQGRCFPRTRWGTMSPASVDTWRIVSAAGEYARKCRIFANGASKRGREDEAGIHRFAADSLENTCYSSLAIAGGTV